MIRYRHPSEQMVELVRSGRKPDELAKEFGCHATSILNWVRQSDAANGTVPANPAALSVSEREELMELRRKLRQVQKERDFRRRRLPVVHVLMH